MKANNLRGVKSSNFDKMFFEKELDKMSKFNKFAL